MCFSNATSLCFALSLIRACHSAEKPNHALDRANNEEHVALKSTRDAPLVALAFKLQESRFGQLTYMRVYQVGQSGAHTLTIVLSHVHATAHSMMVALKFVARWLPML